MDHKKLISIVLISAFECNIDEKDLCYLREKDIYVNAGNHISDKSHYAFINFGFNLTQSNRETSILLDYTSDQGKQNLLIRLRTILKHKSYTGPLESSYFDIDHDQKIKIIEESENGVLLRENFLRDAFIKINTNQRIVIEYAGLDLMFYTKIREIDIKLSKK